MNTSGFSRLGFLSLGIALLGLSSATAYAQGAASQGLNANSAMSQLSAAFSGGKAVQRVQLSGNATWYAGSLEDSGTVTLTASADGSSLMQLILSASGQRSETQSGSGLNATCQWAGDDGIAHEIRSGSCWRPVLWFLPALTVQPSQLPSNIGVVDLGTGTVGSSTNAYRHLQTQLILNEPSNAQTTDIAQKITTDLGLDPVSMLPSVLAYSVYPDNGAPVAIAVEVRYSDYRAVNGVQIPFLIQRYVNGSLQLELRINSAEIA